MKKILIYFFVGLILLDSPCMIYAAENSDQDIYWDALKDVWWRIAEQIGAIVEFNKGNVQESLYTYVQALNPDMGLDEWLTQQIKLHNGQLDVSKELYEELLKLVKESSSKTVNISDYIYKYYPDKELSPNRVPAGTASYDYFVKTVGEAAKTEIKDVKNHKYYWMSFAGQGGWSNDYNGWYYSPRFAYVDTQYEDSVIWIHTDGAVMQPYTYDKDLQSFESVPLNISIYDYSKDDWGNILGESKPGEFYRGSAYWSGGNYNWNALGNYARTGSKFWYCGFDNPEDTVDGYGYFGTVRFPIWVSQEKYIEYMSLYPNYDPTQTVTKNEDNSVTINNYYTTQEKEDQESKKTLEEINKNVKSMKSSWELFRTWIYGELDSIIVKLIAIDDHMEKQIDLLTSIVTNTSGGTAGGGSASGDLSEVIDQLKKINNKLLYGICGKSADVSEKGSCTF